MAITNSAPIPKAPISEETTDPTTGKKQQTITFPYSVYLRTIREDLDQSPRSATPTPVSVPAENASVATTDILTPQADGLYSFQYAAAVKAAAGVSSSLTPVLGWSDGGVPKTKTFAAMTGNTATTTASDMYLFAADEGSPITYALTYASNPVTVMVYNFYAVLSAVAGI